MKLRLPRIAAGLAAVALAAAPALHAAGNATKDQAVAIDGKPFVRERVELAKARPAGFWQDHKFTNPESKRIEPKAMYCERLDETVVCGGVYKE